LRIRCYPAGRNLMTRDTGLSSEISTDAASTERLALIAQISAAARVGQRANDIFDQAVVDHFGVNRTDGRCVDIICESGAITAGELARAANLTTGAVTTVIDRLERAGWVRRGTDPDDRRKVIVELTEQTLAMVTEVYCPIGDEGTDLLAGFEVDELRAVLRYLELDRGLHERHAQRLADNPPTLPAGS
jgi:DNA-binding MarR family transcriptional regulator